MHVCNNRITAWGLLRLYRAEKLLKKKKKLHSSLEGENILGVAFEIYKYRDIISAHIISSYSLKIYCYN